MSAVVAVALVASCAMVTAVAAAHPTGARAHKAGEKQPLCSSYLSTATVSSLSGVPSEPNPAGHHVAYPKSFGVPDAGDAREKISGSVCQWVATKVEGGETGLDNSGQLLVGYDLTAAGWRELAGDFKSGARDTGYPIGFADSPKYRPLELGHGSKAFLVTVDLGAYYGAGYLGPPDLYMVCAWTKRGNILQVWFNGATEKHTATWVIQEMRVKHAKSF